MNLFTKQKNRLTDLENELMAVVGEGWGEQIVREFRMDMYILLYLKAITNKFLLYSTGHSAQCSVAAWMRGEFGEERTQVYVWLSPFAVHLKLSQHFLLIGSIPV